MRRGEIWWARLPPPSSSRPVLLLSRDAAYTVRRSVTVAPVTTRIRGISAEVSVGPEDGLSRQSVVNVDDMTTVRIEVLSERIAALSEDKMRDVEDAIQHALALPGYARQARR